MHQNLDIQGHRGCRGLLPENSLQGFVKAVELGVQTLELDIVISADSQLIVSHEPFFNHEISTLPGLDSITKENELSFNIFKMNLDQVQKIDVGLKPVTRFPLQTKQKAFKPTLKQVVDTVEQYIITKKLPSVKYNIEIKHRKEADNKYNPTAEVFTKMVYDDIVKLGIKNKCNIQSFDPECLNIMHRLDAEVIIALLIENQDGFKHNLDKLTFKPQIYSPYFKLIDDHLLKYCKKNEIKVIPWTVNEETDITNIMLLGVDGIITDYPDKAIEIYMGLKNAKI
ncbi:MAG: glycerophosphodiester phosphodiesterase [Saprospiraceae bacterium]|nr:glycerophosphodiester phosphodiesterase [Saprospiraceae bacterium]